MNGWTLSIATEMGQQKQLLLKHPKIGSFTIYSWMGGCSQHFLTGFAVFQKLTKKEWEDLREALANVSTGGDFTSNVWKPARYIFVTNESNRDYAPGLKQLIAESEVVSKYKNNSHTSSENYLHMLDLEKYKHG